MGILDWLSRKYFGERSYPDTDFPYEADSCIKNCKYAVSNTHGNYSCIVKKHELEHNSVIHGCMHYVSKGEIREKILCPDCNSDLVERTHDHRFKCAGCGRIFS